MVSRILEKFIHFKQNENYKVIKDICKWCSGAGTDRYTHEDCPVCNGKGIIEKKIKTS